MAKLKTYSRLAIIAWIFLCLTYPSTVDCMKKGGMMGGGGGGGVLELLAAGIVAKLLQDMGGLGKLTMGKGGMQQQMTKYVPVPIFVSSGGHMMMNSGWRGGMMMNQGWKGGMMGGNMMMGGD